MALTKLKKAKTAEPLYTDKQMDDLLASFASAMRGTARKAALAVRENYEKRRASGSLILHPKRLSYNVNLADNTITHECCGTTWDAGRWTVSFIPRNYRPGMPFLLLFCPVCGAATKPPDAADPVSSHLANMLEAEAGGGRMTIVADKPADA